MRTFYFVKNDDLWRTIRMRARPVPYAPIFQPTVLCDKDYENWFAFAAWVDFKKSR